MSHLVPLSEFNHIAMYPETFYGHMIAMLEIMVGMFGLAVITGLIFVRFVDRPFAFLILVIDLDEAPIPLNLFI